MRRSLVAGALAALGTLVASPGFARAAEPIVEPLEVRLLRSIHTGVPQQLERDEVLRAIAPGETSWVRVALGIVAGRTVTFADGTRTGTPARSDTVAQLLDRTLAQLTTVDEDLLPSPAPVGFGADDLVYTLTYAAAVSGELPAAEAVLARWAGEGSELVRMVALQAIHNLGTRRAESVVQQASTDREVGFFASTLQVRDQFPPLAELAAHWNAIPDARRDRASLVRTAGQGCSGAMPLALLLLGYLAPAADPAVEREEIEALRRAAFELPLQGCYNARMFGLWALGMRDRAAPALWSGALTRLETDWQRGLAVRIAFAHHPRTFATAALRRLGVEPSQHVQWELYWPMVLGARGIVMRDFWDLWHQAPNRQFRLSATRKFVPLPVAEAERQLDWLEAGHRPADERVMSWMLSELARGARGAVALRVARRFAAWPARGAHAWVLGDLDEPALLPVLRAWRDLASDPDQRATWAETVRRVESGDVNLYTGRRPPAPCCDATVACLLTQLPAAVGAAESPVLASEEAIRSWLDARLDGPAEPVVELLDPLGRTARVVAAGYGELRFDHLFGCWRPVAPVDD